MEGDKDRVSGSAPVRGRARGRTRLRPDQLSQYSGSSVAETTASLAEIEVASVSSLEGLAGSTGAPSDILSPSERSISVATTRTSERDETASNRSYDSDQAKGLRTTLKSGFVKHGSGGEAFKVVTNYFHMNKTPNFQLHQYRVDFSPEEDSTHIKKMLMRTQESVIGSYIFDGHMMYTTRIIPKEKMELDAVYKAGGVDSKFKICIRFVGYVLPTSPTYLQFYNMVMRKCMTLIDMEELGRHFYDRNNAIKLPEDRLELWPGIITAIRNHDAGTLLCVEVTHKVLRMASVLEMIQIIRGRARTPQEFEEAVKKELTGSIVMTHYNRRTYKVDDVDFTVTPSCEFRQQDGTLNTYAEYYLKRYNVQVLELSQPMLVSIPRKKDMNKGITGNIYLIPSLCNPTGLTDDMRKNFQLMQRLSQHLHMNPNTRIRKLDDFINKLKTSANVQQEFGNWDIDFVPNYVMADARKYASEKIFMGPENSEPTYGDKNADWSRALKGRGMLVPRELRNWMICVPDRDAQDLELLISQLRSAARSINVGFTEPTATLRYDPRRGTAAIRDSLTRHGASIQFVFIILNNNNVRQYADLKKLCILDFAVGCQCFLAKNMNSPKAKSKLASICTKVMIQITAKLGGVPWGVKIPVKRLMVLGFDVYHCSERKNYSAGALVATTAETVNQYYSTVDFHKDKSELAKNLTAGMLKSLEAFRIDNNGALPDRIVLFRDGVGEGQINYVLDVEIPRMQEAIRIICKDARQETKLSVVIVTKKINSRALLAKGGSTTVFDNIPSGTVIDNTFTLPERYDYFLVSQSVNQGTVSPTNYNVVLDESGFSAEQMQKLSFKLCHLYYNWCGTVAVPAPCQYAHKLAYLTGVALNSEAPMTLAKNLWYL